MGGHELSDSTDDCPAIYLQYMKHSIHWTLVKNPAPLRRTVGNKTSSRDAREKKKTHGGTGLGIRRSQDNLLILGSHISFLGASFQIALSQALFLNLGAI